MLVRGFNGMILLNLILHTSLLSAGTFDPSWLSSTRRSECCPSLNPPSPSMLIVTCCCRTCHHPGWKMAFMRAMHCGKLLQIVCTQACTRAQLRTSTRAHTRKLEAYSNLHKLATVQEQKALAHLGYIESAHLWQLAFSGRGVLTCANARSVLL